MWVHADRVWLAADNDAGRQDSWYSWCHVWDEDFHMLDSCVIHLCAEDTSLLVAVGAERIPSVLYWGPSLGPQDEAALRRTAVAVARMKTDNDPDVVLEPGILPAAWTGWSGRPGLAGHRVDGAAWSPRLAAVGMLFHDGGGGEVRIAPGQVFEAGAGTLRLDLADVTAGLSVTVELVLEESGLLHGRASVTNEGADDYELEELNLALPVPLEFDELLDCTGRWGRERLPQRHMVTFGMHLREGRHGRTGFDAPGLLVCGRRGFDFRSGDLRGLHVAAPGNHRTYLERLPEGHQVLGGGELLLPGEVRLAPGETYTGPVLHFVHGDGLDAAASRVHRWVRSLPSAPGPVRPVTLNVWEAVGFDHSLPRLLDLADQAARVGVERFVLDDGWFGGRRDDRAGLGDWIVSADVWPEGLHPLVDHVVGLGMEFGLWFEPEMVNPDSDVAREHPDWILAAGPRQPVSWRHQQVLDLTNPEAEEHVRSQMDAVLSEYPISFVKWDHNRDVFDAGRPSCGWRAAVSDQTRAALALMDRLRADHPGLEIESCSSGGGRVDLEMVRHTQRFWASDCIDPHERQSIIRWIEQLIPLEFLGTHVASGRSQTTGRRHDLSFRACTALWGHMGVEWDLTCAQQDELDELTQWIAYYKEHRSLLHTGVLVRDEIGDRNTWLQGVVADDRASGLFEIVSRERGPLVSQGRVRLPGLVPDAVYRIRPRLVGTPPSGLVAPPWFGDDGEGLEMTGALAAAVGLTVPVMDPDQAILVEVAQVTASTDEDRG